MAVCCQRDGNHQAENRRILPDGENCPLLDVCRYLPDGNRMCLEDGVLHLPADGVHL